MTDAAARPQRGCKAASGLSGVMTAEGRKDVSSPQVLDEIPPHSAVAQQPVETVEIWGLPLARIDMAGLVDQVDRLIERGRPSLVVTANLHYAMLSHHDRRLAAINRQAALGVADGMPLVWYSRLLGRPLPERVAGADAVYHLCRRAAERGHRVFLFGAAPGVADEAARRLVRLYPGLEIVGTACPDLARLSREELDRLLAEVRRTRPDLLFAALGQPKGELWLAEHLDRLGTAVCVQIGASLDFVAGRVARAPRWIQRLGAEWLYRTAREPRRMVPRYAADARFLVGALAGDLVGPRRHAASD